MDLVKEITLPHGMRNCWKKGRMVKGDEDEDRLEGDKEDQAGMQVPIGIEPGQWL